MTRSGTSTQEILRFDYVARQRGGDKVRGSVQATNEEEATRLIREKELFPVHIHRSASFSGVLPGKRRVKAAARARFYSQISDLLRAGVPLLRSLEVLSQQSSSPRLAEVLTDIHHQVADGSSIAEAMQEHEQIFGELAISMVRAGQEGGFLEEVFEQIGIFTERQEDLRGTVLGAIAYPIVLLVIGSLVVTVLLVYFVPQFAQIFDRLSAQGELPALTEALLSTSQALQDYGIFIMIALIGLGFYLRSKVRTTKGRHFVDSWKLRIPLAGPIFRDLAITRFNRVLGTLCRNGVPILASLRIAKDSTGNVLMREAIDKAADNVKAGDRLTTPLRESGCFPIEIIEMIDVAEESNTLETVLLESADRLETRTTRQLDLAVRLLEPLLLLVMAAITLLVVIALLLPIFRMSSALG